MTFFIAILTSVPTSVPTSIPTSVPIPILIPGIMLHWLVDFSYSVCFVLYSRVTANLILYIYTCNKRQIHINKLVAIEILLWYFMKIWSTYSVVIIIWLMHTCSYLFNYVKILHIYLICMLSIRVYIYVRNLVHLQSITRLCNSESSFESGFCQFWVWLF